MRLLEIKSIQSNLTAFLKPLSLEDFIELVDYINYAVLETPFKAPNTIAKAFIEEFFSEEIFAKLISDIRDPDKFFRSASISERALFDNLRIALMQESYFKLKQVKDVRPIIKKKEKLTPKDKTVLLEILDEHQKMLEYQLEDESFIHNLDNQIYLRRRISTWNLLKR